MKKLVIIGAGGHGKVVADIAKLNGYKNIVFLDDLTKNEECMGFPIVGTTANIETCQDDADFFVAIGNADVRQEYFNRLKKSCRNIVSLIHPSSVVADCVSIGEGTVVMAGAVINPCVKIGQGTIINTACSIDHDCSIGDYCHVSVGARIAGSVNVGNKTWVGIGAVISNNINVCENCMIGASSLIIKDVKESGTYYGIPAKKFAN